MIHLQQGWFKQSKAVSDLDKPGKIYGFGSLALREQAEIFKKKNYGKLDIYDTHYRPNPFVRQYDLMVHTWLNYYKILDREIEILKANKDIRHEELSETRSLYGIRRQDIFFGAAELRWPTEKEGNAYKGVLVRDPWAEDRINALSDEHEKYVMTFGGAGQGKTHVFSAFQLMMWDHHIFTQRGARCMFSTVSRDKINSATWPVLCRLIESTNKEISLYAGRGEIRGDWTIRRPGNKDTAGVIKGILISNQKNDNSVDKLTGSHGHPFISYLIDEIQSTPLAPVNASSNFTMHCGDYRIMAAGNFNEDTDSLGLNVTPLGGWDTVDETTHRWNSLTTNHKSAIVLHFNNNLSPAMDPKMAEMFPHLPSERNLKEKFPTPGSRDPKKNKQYRRFWIGFRIDNPDGDSVLTQSMVNDNMANRDLDLQKILHRFVSFDSAQAEGDRNLLGDFEEGIDRELKERVWGIKNIEQSAKSSESIAYYTECSDGIITYIDKHKIGKKAIILDWTGRPAHAELMANRGYHAIRLIYNMGVPDGKRENPDTKRIDRPILLDPDTKLFAHQVVDNMISFGAYLLQEYVKSGRVRGINRKMMQWIHDGYSLEEEMFSRRFDTKVSKQYGDLQVLVSKKEFKKQFGFSPDLLDIWFQAAYYMFTVRGLPITPIGQDQNIIPRDSESVKNDWHDGHNNFWKTDRIDTDIENGPANFHFDF